MDFERFFDLKKSAKLTAAGLLFLGACSTNKAVDFNGDLLPYIPEGVEEYKPSEPPTLEQFLRCTSQPQKSYIDAPTDQEIASGLNPEIITITHVASNTDTIHTIAHCYFEQPEYGRMSLEAANPDLNLNDLSPGDSVTVRLSHAMSFDIGTADAEGVSQKTNLRKPLIDELFAIESDAILSDTIMILPKQAPCQKGDTYYVTQVGDTFQSIANKFVTIPDDVSAYNALLPQDLSGDILNNPVDAGFIITIPTHGQVFELPDNSFVCN